MYDVTRRLPEKQREDVAKELTVEIEEIAKGKAGKKQVSKQHVYDVLMELGSPSSFADQYRDKPRYLIGPDYYEPYISILKSIYIVVLPILAFILWMTESLTANHTPISLIVKVLGQTLEVSVHIFFWSTLSMFFVQKVADGQPPDHDWKPDDLPDLPAGQEISRNDSYFAIGWSVLAVLATLYQFPHIYSWLGPDNVPQFFSNEMWPYWTLGLLVVSVAGLIVEVIKLIVRGWTKITVTLIWIINSLSVAFFISVLTFVQQIANPDLLALIAGSLNRPDIGQSVQTGIAAIVYIIVAINIWEIAEATYKYKKGGNK